MDFCKTLRLSQIYRRVDMDFSPLSLFSLCVCFLVYKAVCGTVRALLVRFTLSIAAAIFSRQVDKTVCDKSQRGGVLENALIQVFG